MLLGVKDTRQYKAERSMACESVLMLSVYSSVKGDHGREAFNISRSCCPHGTGHSIQRVPPRRAL